MSWFHILQEVDIWTIKNALKQINVAIFFKIRCTKFNFYEHTVPQHKSSLVPDEESRVVWCVSSFFFQARVAWPQETSRKKGLINDFVVRNNLPWKSTPLGNSKGGQRHSSTSVRVGSKMHQKCHTMTTLFKKYLSILNCKLYYILYFSWILYSILLR